MGSGWTTALSEAEVASVGVTDSSLQAMHLTRTRQEGKIINLTFDAIFLLVGWL